MITLIRHSDGTLEGAVLLLRTGDTIRLAVPDREDVDRFRLRDGRWFSDGGACVEIEFSVADEEVASARAATRRVRESLAVA